MVKGSPLSEQNEFNSMRIEPLSFQDTSVLTNADAQRCEAELLLPLLCNQHFGGELKFESDLLNLSHLSSDQNPGWVL